jgi:hypothetical protein
MPAVAQISPNKKPASTRVNVPAFAGKLQKGSSMIAETALKNIPDELARPHVLLKHDRAEAPACQEPYKIGTLELYCESPLPNPPFSLIGIYPSLNAALAAAQADRARKAGGAS